MSIGFKRASCFRFDDPFHAMLNMAARLITGMSAGRLLAIT